MSEAPGSATDRAGHAAGEAADRAGEAADRAGEAADRASEAAGDAADKAQDAAEDASGSRPFRIAARSGFVVNGILHVLIGIIAIRIATGNGGSGQADQSGALRQIAQAPGGLILLWFLVVGLVALGAWQVVQLVRARSNQRSHPWLHRLSDLSKAIVYFAIAATAFTFARGSSTNSSSTSTTASARLLRVPGGEAVLIAVGLGVLGVGVYFVVRGLSLKFRNDLDVPRPPAGPVVTVAGVIGYVAKGVALGVVGILVVVAAWTVDPQKATGLDGALLTLAHLHYGRVILLVVGIGLIVYGVYFGARARWGKLD